jgi:hypothetical protein
VFPSVRLRGQEAVVRVHHGAEVSQTNGGEGRSDQGRGEGAFRLSQLPARAGHGAGEAVRGILRHEDFGTTMQLYAQSDKESMREAQGKFLEQLWGDRIHLLTERVQ